MAGRLVSTTGREVLGGHHRSPTSRSRSAAVLGAAAALLAACASTSSSTRPASGPVVVSTGTGVSATPGASSSAPSAEAAVPACTRSALALAGPLEGFGGATGEHELTYAVRNVSSRSCSLNGYPTVRLFDPGPMAFVYDNAPGASAYLSSAPPSQVVIGARGQAYLQVVKYRCDLGQSSLATRIRITLPDRAGVFDELLGPPVASAHALGLCTGQPHDPGNVVGVTPIRLSPLQLVP